MWTFLTSGSFSWWVVILLGLIIVVGYAAYRIKTGLLKADLLIQKAIVEHQEQVISGLEESLKNAEVKRKHDEVAKSISDDALRERMQHEGYYRD